MTDQVEEVPCGLCGSSRSKVRFQALEGWPGTLSGDFAATTDRFGAYGTIRRCLDCGHLYTSPRLKASAIDAGYAENEDPDYLLESESRCMNAYLSLPAIRRHCRGGRLLDIGCSAGFFLNAARLSFSVSGVEPSAWARRWARENLKLDDLHPSLDAARFPAESFDAVTLIDVIEHLPDPLAVLKEVRRITKPGGIAYLVTPDAESLSARLLGGRWWGLRPAHIHYFSRKTLRDALRAAGFEPVLARSYGRIFTWDYWLSRLANYPKPLYASVEAAIRLLRIEDKFLYLDTRDSVQVVARRT